MFFEKNSVQRRNHSSILAVGTSLVFVDSLVVSAFFSGFFSSFFLGEAAGVEPELER